MGNRNVILMLGGCLFGASSCTLSAFDTGSDSTGITQQIAETPIASPVELAEAMQAALNRDPPPRPARRWLQCQERLAAEQDSGDESDQFACSRWTYEGVTSTLVAIRSGKKTVPVIETYLEGNEKNQKTVLHVTGGTGGEPLYTRPVLPKRIRAYFGGDDSNFDLGITSSPHMELLSAGYTIVSVVYWGTSFRTLNEKNEIGLAISDVQTAFEHYKVHSESEITLLTESLGNHLTLAALGPSTLSKLDHLAIVPVMDGLRHSLAAFDRLYGEHSSERGLITYHVYAGSPQEPSFVSTQLLPSSTHMRNFLGDADHPFKDVEPKSVCSRIVLGRRDYRTKNFLESTYPLPSHIVALNAGHDVYADARSDAKGIFRNFVRCLHNQKIGKKG